MGEFISRGLKSERTANNIVDAIQNIGEAAHDISHGKVNAKTLERLMQAQEITKDVIKAREISGAIDYCLHGVILMQSLDHAKTKALEAHSALKKKPLTDDLGIISSSLSFRSYLKKPSSEETTKGLAAERRFGPHP